MKYVEIDGIQFEALTTGNRVMRDWFINPMINYILPRWLLRALLRGRSPLVDACVREPGSWECMRLSYEDQEAQGAIDKLVQKYGSFPMALRNRKRLVTRMLSELIFKHPVFGSPVGRAFSVSGVLRELVFSHQGPVHIVGVAAGTGHNIMEAMRLAPDSDSHAYMVDLSDGAVSFGRELAQRLGLADRITFIQGNVLEIDKLIDVQPDIVVAVGILEYFTDEQVADLLKAMYKAAPSGGTFVANSIQPAHGSDRFLRTVLGLHVNYREPDHLRRLLSDAGYTNFTVRSEPLGIYSILVGRKR